MSAKKKTASKKKTAAKKAAQKNTTARKSTRKKTASKKTVAKKVAHQAGNADNPDSGMNRLDFPVVGIGASAGGFEAMAELLKYLRPDIGMAFVLVQHLSPEHKSMMAELLGQETRLTVTEIRDGMAIEPNHLYVIPPNFDLAIMNSTLQLMPRESDRRKPHLSIDYFFQTLAADQGSNAIGIVLSGSASDGTLGLKAIKAANGITLAQDTDTAHYDSMPASAIAAGCVDFVMTPQEMANELGHIARHPEALHADIVANQQLSGEPGKELDKIFVLMRNRTGNDFSYYKHTTIRRRIARRMLVHKIDRVKDYVRYLTSHPAEVDALFQDILINVTGFFRDKDAFESLKTRVFPAMLNERPRERPVRIWVPGCSTGEEVYSIIISLLEYLGEDARGRLIQVFASDIDEQALNKARVGIYPEGITADVSPERLRRYFSKVPQGYQINKSVRDLCVFARQNIIKDPPFSHQDLIACRNMLIYMGPVLQRKVLQTLHYALEPKGFLMLGSSESIGGAADLFITTVPEQKIYQRKQQPRTTYKQALTTDPSSLPTLNAPTGMAPAEPKPVNLQNIAESIIVNHYAPPAVVVNERLDVMQFVGHTGPYLDPSPGAASLNLVKLAHPELAVELRVLAHNAMQDNQPTHKEGIRLQYNGNIQELRIEIVPLQGNNDTHRYYLVLFRKQAEYPVDETGASQDIDKKAASDEALKRIQELEHELEDTKTYMQSIIEEQEASNEELQSANEEIQSTNEELQSTNEELETAKEELQSTNEELITVNEELEHRNNELSTSNDDLHNLIASTELPLIMLNEELNIRFISPKAYRLLNLIESDIGRSISDIRTNLKIGDLGEYVNGVLDTLKPMARDVRDNNGHWYTLRIRPYRTQDNRIKGVVMVFVDISESKALQRASRLATVVEDSNDAVTVLDFDGNILAWNRRAREIYGFSEDEALGANMDIVLPEAEVREMKTRIEQIQRGQSVAQFETSRQTRQGMKIRVQVTMSVLRDEKGYPEAIATTERLLDS